MSPPSVQETTITTTISMILVLVRVAGPVVSSVPLPATDPRGGFDSIPVALGQIGTVLD